MTAAATLHRHGGRLAAARARFPSAPEPWLDLSTGVNPRPWRGARAAPAALARLPDPEAVRDLEALAARAFGLPADRVAATPGTEAAIRALPWLTGARSVGVVSPTYGGHGEAWRLAGARVEPILRGALADAPFEAVVLVNPNNPDGAVVAPAELAQAAGDRWLIVDEAFVETAPELSVASAAGGRLVVLRSFGKFYGLAGVRLGFVLAEPAFAQRVRDHFGDWPLGAEAICAGAGAYADDGWAQATRARLARAAARLDRALVAAGYEVVGGTSLFRLVRRADAARRFEGLASRGVLVRPFIDQPDWLRFGLPPAGAWSRLAQALEARP